MSKKEIDINIRRQLLDVQESELHHLPHGRQVFKSMGTVLMPADKNELLEEIEKERKILAQSLHQKS